MKHTLKNEIEKYFALKSGYGAYKVEIPSDGSFFWTFNDGTEYGVFFEYQGDDIFERFSGTELKSDFKIIEGTGPVRVIMLACKIYSLRNEFSLLCEDFADPGNNGEKRNQILNNPLHWWEQWKNLLGNSQKNKRVYDVIGELLALLRLCELGKSPFWSAAELSSHDIETADESYEVKSTLSKSMSHIHANSQYQLSSEKSVYLIFTRMEKSAEGHSIDDLIKKIEAYQPEYIIKYRAYLIENGFEEGNHSRKVRYKMLERRKLLIDESFPHIDEKLFIDGKLPDRVTHLEYDVDIDGLEYVNW